MSNQDTEKKTIEYKITGREDGSWVIKAFDRNDNQIGAPVKVKTVNEAWKVWCVLNGYTHMVPEEIEIESTRAA